MRIALISGTARNHNTPDNYDMKKLSFLIKFIISDCLIVVISSYSLISAQNSTASNNPSSLFITGLSKATVYSKDQAEKGSEYNYKDGRSFKIKFFFNQVDVAFYAYNENNQREEITTPFEVGYYTPDGEWYGLKDSIKYLVGQYDFDADDIDEIVVALQDNDEDGNGISINVYKLQNDSWTLLGSLTGKAILGEPIAEVKMNKITIQRHLRGFYYQWTLESGKFKDTGDY